VRDFYREWCNLMELPMHSDVAMRYAETSTLLIAPVCPHFAEKIWSSVLGRSGSVLHAPWPSAGTVDAKASRELRFLQKTMKNLRAKCAKDKKAAQAKTATIYIAERYNDWKVATLDFMRTLWKPTPGGGGSLPDKKALMVALTSGLLAKDPTLSPKKKLVMQFAAFMAEEAESGLGLEALDTTLAFNQMEVLSESREYLAKHLIVGKVLDIELKSTEDGVAAADAKSAELAEPGKPNLVLSA